MQRWGRAIYSIALEDKDDDGQMVASSSIDVMST